MGDELGGEMGGDMGPEEMPAGDAGAEEPAGDDSALLAVPPGSRDAPRLTPGAKGKVYKPVKKDKRRDAGPRTRSYAGKRSAEKSSSTKRNVFPGSEINTIPSIAKGIYEEEQSIYILREKSEEDKLFEINDSIRNLLLGMENKNRSTEHKDEN
jgi:hypothetical protein